MVSDLSKDGQAIEYKWKLFCIVELACTTGKLFLGRVLLKYLVLAYGVQPRSRPIGIVRTGQEKMDKDLVELWLFADRSTGLWAAHDQRGYVFWLSECVNSTPYEVRIVRCNWRFSEKLRCPLCRVQYSKFADC
jgi:hypothetical protein